MKYLRLTWAEIKKLLLRPTFYILVACLFVAIIVSSFLFLPTERPKYRSSVSGVDVNSIYTNFIKEDMPLDDGKVDIKKKIDSQFAIVENFNSRTDLEEFQVLAKALNEHFYQLENAIKTAKCNATHVLNINESIKNMSNYLNGIDISSSKPDYLIKSNDFEAYKDIIRNFQTALPSSVSAINKLTDDEIFLLCKSLWENYKDDVDFMSNNIQGMKKITLDEEFLNEIQAFKSSVNAYLQAKEEKIADFYKRNSQQGSEQALVIAFRELLNDYKASFEICKIAIGDKLDSKLLSIAGGNPSQYLGYEDISLYALEEETSFYTYVIDNKYDYSKALTGLNFNQNSGIETNGYDFAYYMIAVASLMLNLILVYFACMIFSGERHDGQMRMNLTKPVSRYKLYFAKLSALLMISLVAHIVLGLLLLGISCAIYGTASGCVLISIFSSSSAFAVAPFGNFLLKIFSLFLTSAFYITISCFVSILFSNPVFSVVVSYLVYAFALITNTLLPKYGFLKFLPFIHTDISTFFGGGIWGNTFLGSLIYSGASFPLSICYYTVVLVAIITASIQIFKRQEL